MTSKLIAVAAQDDRGLDGEVSDHFGGSPAFVLVDTDDGRIQGARIVDNPHYGNHRPGVMPRFIRSTGAHAILAGGMGARAVSLFRAVGIDVATGATGSVRRVVEAYLCGELNGIAPCTHDHHEGCGE